MADTYEQAQEAYRANDLPRARDILLRVLERDPNDVRARFALGACELGTGRPGPAETAFRQTLELDPYHVEAAERLALALDQQGRTADAEHVRKEAARLAASQRDAGPAEATHQHPGGYSDPYGLAPYGYGAVTRGFRVVQAAAVVFAVVVLAFIGFVAYQIISEEDMNSPYEDCVATLGKERCKGIPK